MDGIKIKSSINRECYTKILRLKNRLDMAECIPPSSSNAMGDVYRGMESMGKSYAELKKAMSELLECTAKFIINTDTAFKVMDNGVAEKLAE